MRFLILTLVLNLTVPTMGWAQIELLNQAKALVADSQKVVKPDSVKSDTVQLHDSLIQGKAEEKTTILEKGKEFLPDPGSVGYSLLLIGLTWLLLRLVKRILNIFAERSARYRIQIKGTVPVVSFLLWAMAGYIIVVKIFAPPQQTLWAGLASAGIALGFAAQDILKNIFAGIVILFDAPFRVGDKIEIDKYYGEVKQIGLRSTKIITPDDSLVTVPNSDLMNTAVSNSNSGEANCQVVAEFYLPIGIDTDRVRQIATEAAQVSKYVYLNKPIVVLFFNEVRDHRVYMKMRLKAYVLDIRAEFAFKSDMTELVIEQLIAEGIIQSETNCL